MPPYPLGTPRSTSLARPLLRQLDCFSRQRPLPRLQLKAASRPHSTNTSTPLPQRQQQHRLPSSPSRLLLRRRPICPRLQQQTRHASTQPPSNPVSPNITPSLGSPSPTLTLSQRMRKLSREYGWAAFGVYMGLSALDFPFCFLAVRALGTERIGEWEHAIITTVKGLVGRVIPLGGEVKEKVEEGEEKVRKAVGMTKVEKEKGAVVGKREGEGKGQGQSQGQEEWSWGVEEAQKEASKENATLWTQLVLAYAIHKSFIFIRVPLTAAVTPKVVKTLRGWGWNIGKRPTKKTLTTTTTTTPKSP